MNKNQQNGDSKKKFKRKRNAEGTSRENSNRGVNNVEDANKKCSINTNFCRRVLKEEPGSFSNAVASKRSDRVNNGASVSKYPLRKRPPRLYPIGEATLKDLLQQETFIIARRLTDERSGYALLVSDATIPPTKFDLVIQLLYRAVQCKVDRAATLQLLLMTFQKSQFVNQLCTYTSSLKFYLDKAKEYLPYIVGIIENFVKVTPTEAFLKVSSLTDLCSVVMKQLARENVGEFENLKTTLSIIQTQLQETQTKWMNNQKRGTSTAAKLDCVLPPEHIKTLNVAPSCSDLLQTRVPFLRRNIIDGPYVDSEHYLDVHFRLMREDFIRPFREGLRNFLNDSEDKNYDVRVYKNVRYVDSKIEETGLVYYLALRLSKDFDPNKSKRFMFENILCLSCDNFQTVIIASVCNRDSLGENLLGIHFPKIVKNTQLLDVSKCYVLLESKAYFGSYVHTLTALQKFEKVPFENFIVKVEDSNCPPSYLKNDSVYDFSSFKRLISIHTELDTELEANGSMESLNQISNLAEPNSEVHREGSTEIADFDKGSLDSGLNQLAKMEAVDLKKVYMLEGLHSWPTCDILELDDSQRRALHGALTRQLAIIQGPPGTGKTHVGLDIAKLLLYNKDVWQSASVGKKGPILVVCYTNHALDQFLEGILRFTRKIVRVGSRSKNEALIEFNINNILKNRDRESFVGRTLSSGFGDALRTLDMVKRILKEINKVIDQFANEVGIIHADVFRKYEVFSPFFELYFKNVALAYFLLYDCKVDFFASNLQPMNFDSFMAQNFDKAIDVLKETKNIDKEIFDEEQRNRIFDNDFDFMNDERKVKNETAEEFSNLCRFQVSLNKHVEEIRELQTKLNSTKDSRYRRDCIQFYQRLDVLKKELNIIRKGITITPSKKEIENLERVCNISSLSLPQRWMLYNHWRLTLVEKIRREKHDYEKQFLQASRNLESLRNVEYLSKMRAVDVVGMTTTGAAKHWDILYDLAPPIVIVEEAAEILEAHVISSLSENCQHLILIGDHQQLQPNPSVYRLAVHYNLNVSLFERLIKNGIAYTRLEYQHRMKPCISDLLVPTIYEDLQNHPSVFVYPKIRGLEKDLFFLDHDHKETKRYPSRHDIRKFSLSAETYKFPLVVYKNVFDNESVENLFEAEFALALCRHLLFQGYSNTDITILSPYSGQHRLIKERQKDYPHCDGVRVSILDNYQGEECNIIILSLVRSNDDGNVGFVKSDNRVCVALSRAKHGFYLIGNMTQFSEACPLWSELKQKFVDGENLGSQMTLVCGNHPDVVMKVQCAQDFIMMSPEGGCIQRCHYGLPKCDHACPRACHVFDTDHATVECQLPCPKTLCQFAHPCPNLCYQKCPPCKVFIEKVLLCGHTHQVECGVDVEAFHCPTEVQRMPGCKHEARMKCYEKIEFFVCKFDCDARLDCGHKCLQKCHVKRDPDHEEYLCLEKCDRNPDNCAFNHVCKKQCHEACGPCPVIIKMNLPCGHTLEKVPCGILINEVRCPKACEKTLNCSHPCPKTCGEPCGGCKVQVKKTIPSCNHSVVMDCGNTPQAKYCTSYCERNLGCGHRCPRRCKDACLILGQCRELVVSQKKCPQQHFIKLPCSTISATAAGAARTQQIVEFDNDLWESCSENCGKVLDCGHVCPGKCGDCYNGRFHVSCKSKCNKALVCGHICKAPCSSACPPCQSQCEMKCVHSHCTKKCGIPCVNCKYWCKRGCKHSRCKAKCKNICSFKPCEKPCPKKIEKCGHACIGYCGERCPLLCRICDKEEVESIFFGEEDNSDARFIVLEDCGHEFESNGLKGWMNTVTEEIGMKKCPKCSKPIYNAKRFHSNIMNSLNDVIMVKMKHFTKGFNVQTTSFIPDLKMLMSKWPNEVKEILRRIGFTYNFQKKQHWRQPSISDMELNLISFKIDFLKNADKLELKVKGRNQSDCKLLKLVQRIFNLNTCVSDQTRDEDCKLLKLVQRIFNLNTCVSDQTRDEAMCELRRISVTSALTLQARCSDEKVKKILETIKLKLSPVDKFSTDLEKEIVSYLKEAEKIVGELNILKAERQMIVKVMGFKQGHWYKCPNGHIYAIGNCGGANQVAKCPECKATIGGENYTLHSGNTVAAEMDGATRPAWPGGY